MGSIKFLGGKLCEFFKFRISLGLLLHAPNRIFITQENVPVSEALKYKENDTEYVTFEM